LLTHYIRPIDPYSYLPRSQTPEISDLVAISVAYPTIGLCPRSFDDSANLRNKKLNRANKEAIPSIVPPAPFTILKEF